MMTERNQEDGAVLSYADWERIKASHRASEEDRDFLVNRVRRLRDEQRSLEANIVNAKEKLAAVHDARRQVQRTREECRERREVIGAEIVARQQAAAAQRQKILEGVESAQRQTRRTKATRRQAVLNHEAQLQRASSARRADEVAALVRRREAIRHMEMVGLAQRREYLQKRRELLLREHARTGDIILKQREENIKAAAALLVVEADLVRTTVELRGEFKKQCHALAHQLLTPRPPPSRRQPT